MDDIPNEWIDRVVPYAPITDPKQIEMIKKAFADANEQERFEERAAIMEFDGNLPRAEAERLARFDTEKK